MQRILAGLPKQSVKMRPNLFFSDFNRSGGGVPLRIPVLSGIGNVSAEPFAAKLFQHFSAACGVYAQ